MLYPLKFKPIIKEKVWGGKKLANILNKNTYSDNAGESWEISGLKDNLSVVTNGLLEGKSIIDVIKEYKHELLGNKVYKTFGESFPLLIKFIDASDDLSVQVHPDDNMAQKRHMENGKTEIWYIIDAEEDSELILGVKKDLTKSEYVNYLEKGKLNEILNSVKVKSGDVAYIPAGRIHAIMKGVFLAEIQQTSDLTYRIYDWDRMDLDGTARELHTELALDVVDLKKHAHYLTKYEKVPNTFSKLINNNFFSVSISEITEPVKRDYSGIDSFIILIIISGELKLNFFNGHIDIKKGETILLPATINQIELNALSASKILEVYI